MAVKRRKSTKFTTLMQKKLLIVFMVVMALLVFLSVMMIKINVSKGSEYSKAVYNNFNYSSRTIAARRGDITDRNGTVLAYSTKVYNLILDAKVLLSDETYKEPTIDALLTYFDIDENELREYIEDNESRKEAGENVDSYKRLLTELTDEETEDFVEAMNEENSLIKGVWLEDEYKRTYPFGSFACDLIGFASEANGGELGIESYYENELAGTDGRIYGYINDSEYEATRRNASNGSTVVSTIDFTVQNIIEQAIRDFNEEYGSKSTSVVVVDPDTMEVLGMADYPVFDLNNPRDLTSIYSTEELEGFTDDEFKDELYGLWNNYSVSSIYEPGSVFKAFTIAESIEEQKASLKDVFTCDGEGIYDASTILCHGGVGHGDLTLSGALTESCNDALMQISMRLGPSTFCNYLNTFKFGIRTGIDLPAEENGLLIDEDSMMDVDLATNSFGQNLNVTMMQMVSSFASIINGGYYYQPHVVKEILSESGETIESFEPVLVTQTVSSETSRIMREMLRAVVDYGTGGYVHIDGYSIGGKTGTAEKAGRDKSEYVISFMGFAPAEDPEVLVYVVIDAPDCEEYNTSWSAQVLARAIMEKLLPYMGIMADNADYDTDIYLDTEDLDKAVVKPEITTQNETQNQEETTAEAENAPEGEQETLAENVSEGETQTDDESVTEPETEGGNTPEEETVNP